MWTYVGNILTRIDTSHTHLSGCSKSVKSHVLWQNDSLWGVVPSLFVLLLFFIKKITLERVRPIENCLYLIQCKKEMIYDCQLDSYPHKTQWKGCNQLQEPYDLHKRLRGEQNIKDAHNFFFYNIKP